MSLKDTQWWEFKETVKEALAGLADDMGVSVVYKDIRNDERYLDVEVDGKRAILTHGQSVLEDFRDNPKSARKLWPEELKKSYRAQLEQQGFP